MNKANIQKKLEELMHIDIDRDVRQGRTGRVEENVKIKMTIPLLGCLGYNEIKDMDFEHHVRNKIADIALMFTHKPKMIVETKDLGESLDVHVDQALDYTFKKGVNWAMLTNGTEIRVYKSFIEGVPPEDRLLFSTTLERLSETFSQLYEYVSRDSLLTEKVLEKKAEEVRENITEKRLIKDFSECRDMLFNDLYTQFKERYEGDIKFRKTINDWAESVKMDLKDPNLVEKLCKGGVYTLLNRLLFLRICEDKGYVKPKLTEDGMKSWKMMTSKPMSGLLGFAFREIGEQFEGLYYPPLFDNINYEEIEWNEDNIETILKRFGEHNFARITKDVLGRAYEQHVSREERKQLGQFYTPDFIIDYILSGVGISTDKKILDPACGSGGFLMRAYDRLGEQYRAEGWDEKAIHKEILKRNLFGIDINPFATQLTVMNLLLKDLEHPTSEINIVEGDTLEKLEDYLGLNIFEKESSLKGVTKADKKATHGKLLRRGPFDIVVGNPPYISFGLRGTGKLKKGLSKYFRENYPNSAEYKLSIYAIFMDRGIQLLTEGGEFGFIVPDSFLLGRYFSKIRRYILDTCKIKEITLFSKDFWDYGCVGRPVVITLQKESDKSLREGNNLTAKLCSSTEDIKRGKFRAYSYGQSYFWHVPHNRLRLFFDEESKKFVDGMEKDSPTLNELVSIHTGVRSKIGQKNIISGTKKGAAWKRGLISGSEIDRYLLMYAGSWINIDPNKLWSGGWDPEIISNPKLLMRQTGDSLIAAYDDNGYYHLNNLHSLAPKGAQYNLKCILALLNSKLMNHYYHLISLELGRAMAQTDIETLEYLPIRPASSDMQEEFVRMTDKILCLNKALNDPSCNIKELQKEIHSTDKKIDNLVFDLYKIDRNMRNKIREAIVF